MKMKKILSVILSASMLMAAVSLPVLADDNEIELFNYTAVENDVEKVNNTYDDGAATNSIDASKALKAETETALFKLEDDKVMTKEYFLSFDFCFDTESGDINIKGSKGQGPWFHYIDGKLKNQTGGSSYAELAAISLNKWYTAELEGRMCVTNAETVFRLYEYVDGVKTLVQTKNSNPLSLRNFYAGQTKYGNPNTILVNGVSIDNVKLIQEYPNTIEVTASPDEINAGATSALNYVLKRNEAETTKYPVEWSVYDESNTTEITDGSVSVTSDGVLSAKISSPTQKVTVRAATDLEGKELVGTKQVQINEVDTSAEKFDHITVKGEDTVKAGTEAIYTVEATKDGADVTGTLAEGDVVWSVYDYADLNPNGNKAITVSDGVLKIDDSVIAQNITLRATSKSGNVYGSIPVKIEFSDKQTETVLYSSACEETLAGMEKIESWDGSTAYKSTASVKLPGFGKKSDYVLTELDIKFTAEGSGFTLDRDGTLNSCYRYHNNMIQMQTGSSNYSELMAADTDKWYHIEALYLAGKDASCNIYEYKEDGTLGEPRKFTDISRRNDKEYSDLQIEPGSIVDNIKIVTPQANSIDLKAVSNKIYSGDTDQITATVSRNGLPLKGDVVLEWALKDSSGKYILDGPVKIDGTGLITTTQMAPTQTVKVEVKSGDYVQTMPIEIELLEPFDITNIGINEAGNKIVKLYMNKKAGYNDDVLFIVAIYDENHVLKGFGSAAGEGKSYGMGEQEVNFDFDLTSIDFDSEKDIITAFVWTRF